MNTHTSQHILSNGRFELVVSPATGRIVRYGPVHGPNMLWENPLATSTPSPFEGWINWGGDKVWIWPENDWAKWQSGTDAPPGDPPSAPYEVEVNHLSLRMTSPVLVAYGIRIVREISLDAGSSKVTFVNHLEKVAEGKIRKNGRPRPVGVWTVTQIPAARQILARLIPNRTPPRHESFAKGPWRGVQVINDVALLPRPTGAWAKIGLEADVLAMPVGDWFFVIRAPVKNMGLNGYEPFRRAQVFSDPDVSEFRPDSVPPYVEFEFTSPLEQLAVGGVLSLAITWELHPLAKVGTNAVDIINAAQPDWHNETAP